MLACKKNLRIHDIYLGNISRIYLGKKINIIIISTKH